MSRTRRLTASDLDTLIGKTITGLKQADHDGEYETLSFNFDNGTSIILRTQDASNYQSWFVIEEPA